jgi:ribonuclease VapC
VSVADASAVLAVLLREVEAERVAPVLAGARMSSVNLCEVMTRTIDAGGNVQRAGAFIAQLEIEVHPFTEAHAERAAELRRRTRRHGLSLGDRACLALAQALDAPVLTADRAWTRLGLGLDVRLIR